VVTGDFNGDGKLDLAVANTNSNTFSILLGKGDGTFQAAPNFATGDGPRSLAVGDFNGDGKLDLAIGCPGGVSVLLGNSNGTFQPAKIINLNGQSVAVGDFNGDGKLDLAVTENRYYYYGGASYANVLLGKGDGSFSAPHTTLLDDTFSDSAAVADFNGDGKLDFAAVSGATVRVLLGDGNGNLLAPTNFNVAEETISVAAGDVNGDGHIDLVTANKIGNNVSVLLGNGAGGFGAAQNYAAGTNPSSVTLGDFNRDGKLDIVTANYAYLGYVSVLLGNGHGTFSPAVNYAAHSTYAWSVAVGDFNGDGFPDLAVANSGSNNVSALLNAADWSTLNSFLVTGFPSPTTAGASATFTVTAKNGFGSTLTGYTGTVHFSSSASQAVLPPDYTFTAADNGVHTFAATLKSAASGLEIRATDTVKASATGYESGITVNPAALSQLGVIVSDGKSVPPGTPFIVWVSAQDSYKNTITGYTGTIHITSSDPAAVLPGDFTFTAADQGIRGFYATLNTLGTQTITATDTVTPSITGSVAVTVGPSTLFVAGFPSPTTAGVAGAFTITVKNTDGTTAYYYTGTVHFTSSDAQAVLPADYTFIASDAGVHTFSATLKTAGTQSLTVTDSTTASLTGTDAGITVKPGAASLFLITAPSSVSAGVPLSLTLTVKDAYGNVVTGYTGTIHFTSTDNKATLPKNYTFTAADKGMHTFTGLVLRKKGKQTITITDRLNSALTGSVIENVV
jgi:hypothetical protein